MFQKGGITVLLATAALATVVVPPIGERDIIELMTYELISSKAESKPSYKYFFPDYYLNEENGSNVVSFGVKTNGSPKLFLHDTSASKHPDIMLTLGPGLLPGFGKVCSASFVSAAKDTKDTTKDTKATNMTSPCMELSPERFTWFTLERTNSYVALYRAGSDNPVLELSNLGINRFINLNFYYQFSVASQYNALWDFMGSRFSPVADKSTRKVTATNSFLEVGLKRARSNYKQLQLFVQRCDIAVNASSSQWKRPVKYKANKYYMLYCKGNKVQPFRDALTRHEAILLSNGVPEPAITEQETEVFFRDEFIPK